MTLQSVPFGGGCSWYFLQMVRSVVYHCFLKGSTTHKRCEYSQKATFFPNHMPTDWTSYPIMWGSWSQFSFPSKPRRHLLTENRHKYGTVETHKIRDSGNIKYGIVEEHNIQHRVCLFVSANRLHSAIKCMPLNCRLIDFRIAAHPKTSPLHKFTPTFWL